MRESEIGCLTSHASIFQFVTAHICAGVLKKLNLRSGSQRHRNFVGFFNVPVQTGLRGLENPVFVIKFRKL